MMKLTLPENHPSIERTINAIGINYYHNGKYSEALKYLKGFVFLFHKIFFNQSLFSFIYNLF